MLLSFKAENFLSFGEEMEFSMIQKSNERRFSHRVAEFDGKKVSRIRSIRGANGAGKSNLVKALKFLVNSVTKGELDLSSFSRLSNKLLDNNSISSFSFSSKPHAKGQFILNYSLKFDAVKILYERIEFIDYVNNLVYSFSKEFNKNKNNYIYKKDDKLDEIQNNDVDKIKSEINYKLLLFNDLGSTGVLLSRILKTYLNDTLNFESNSKQQSKNSLITSNLFSDLKKFNLFKQIICGIDSGISDMIIAEDTLEKYFGSRNSDKKIEVEKKLKASILDKHYVEYDEDVDEYLYYFLNKEKKPSVKFLKFYHKNENGENVEFFRGMESEGTQRILDLYPKLVSAFYTPSVLIIDEIEKSIHPNLLQQFIKKLLDFPEMKGQIIYTTHDTSTLDLNIFKQDEICFAHKNEKGNTEFHLLSDYEGIRNDLDIRKAYLNGRFDGIPYLEDLRIVDVRA